MVTRTTPFHWVQSGSADDAIADLQNLNQAADAPPAPASAVPASMSAATNASSGPVGFTGGGATTQPATSGLVINLIADSSVANAPSGFTQAVQAAAQVYEQTFSDLNVTINITYGWGTLNNQVDTTLTDGAEGGALNGDDVSYATLKSWLTANVNSVADSTMVASLPASVSGNPNFFVGSAQEKALGVFTGDPTALDGAIGFGTQSSPSFWLEAALHEIGHVLGRNTAFYDSNGEPAAMDLLRYSAPGTFQWTGGQPAYLSIDGGKTDLANFDTTSDFSDFAVDNLTPNDPYDFQSDGSVHTLTPLDVELTNVLGFEVPLSSGTLNISAGQGSRDVTLLSSGEMDVLSGGTTSGAMDGGLIFVSSGGAATSTTISGSGQQQIVSGGTASGTVVVGGGSEFVFAGGTESGTVVSSGAFDAIGWTNSRGGTAIGNTINSGGTETVYSGGMAGGTVVSGGGIEDVLSGGTASGTTLSGGVEYDYGVASGTVLDSGGGQLVESGARAVGAQVSGGGTVVIYAGGTLVSAMAVSGGWLYDAGTLSATTLSGGFDAVSSGGVAIGTLVEGGGLEEVLSGGTVIGTTASSGGVEYDFGVVSSMVLDSSGYQLVESGGRAAGTQVSSGAAVAVYAGAALVSAMAVSGGGLYDLGMLSGTTLSGGFDVVSSGSMAIGTLIEGGGIEEVLSGGTASGTTASSGVQYDFGVVSGMVLGSSGYQLVESGGRAVGTQVISGTAVAVYAGGALVSATALSGGGLYDFGTLSGVTLSGGFDVVSSGGVAIGTLLKGGGIEEVLSGGTASGGTTLSGGVQYVFGVVSGMVVGSGGDQTVEGGGRAVGTTASSGAAVAISAGGTLLSATALSGGGLYDFGTLSGAALSGGFDVVSSGGVAIGTLVEGGSIEEVASGGMASGALVEAGGFETVESGGVASGTVINGGGMDVTSGGSASLITFSGSGGELRLDASTSFGGTIAGLGHGDLVDLSDIAFGSGTTVGFSAASGGTSGTLTVNDGTHTANILLLGQYMAGQFTLAADGHGGTLITDNATTAAVIATPHS